MPHPDEDARRDDREAEHDRDAEDVVNEELPLDPTGPTEFGEAVDE